MKVRKLVFSAILVATFVIGVGVGQLLANHGYWPLFALP